MLYQLSYASKPPVTGHKVNKLAQRQSACNSSTPLACKGNETCVAPALIYCNNSSALAATAPRKKDHFIYTNRFMFKHRKLLILASLLVAAAAIAFVFYQRSTQSPE